MSISKSCVFDHHSALGNSRETAIIQYLSTDDARERVHRLLPRAVEEAKWLGSGPEVQSENNHQICKVIGKYLSIDAIDLLGFDKDTIFSLSETERRLFYYFAYGVYASIIVNPSEKVLER